MQATLDRLRERRERRDDEAGFTLIELLIVIVILGILAGIVVFAVQDLTGGSAAASCGSDYKTVETAAEAYKAQVGVYPGAAFPTAGYSVVGSIPGNSPGVTAMLNQVSIPGNPGLVGPWLKDNPVNPAHYEIQYLATGVEQVYNSAGTQTIPLPGTGTAADCASVP